MAGEAAAVAADALGWAAEGYSIFKLKLGGWRRRRPGASGAGSGGAGGEDQGRRQRGLGRASRPLGTLSALEEFDLEFAEQPVASLDELAELAGRTAIPLAGDESIETRAQMPSWRPRWAPAGWPRSSSRRSAGPEEAIAIAEVIPSYLSSALDGPVGIAAAAHRS